MSRAVLGRPRVIVPCLALVFSMLALGGAALTQAQDRPKVDPRLRWVSMSLPDELRGSVVSQTFDVEANGVRGQMRLTVTPKGEIVDLQLSEDLIDRGVPTDLLIQPLIFKRVANCIRENKCADKPTNAGVITCVASCLLSPIQASVTR